MSTKQHFTITRYSDAELPPEAVCPEHGFPWLASIQPDNDEWVLFVPKDGSTPQLWVFVGEVQMPDCEKPERSFAPIGSPAHQAYLEAMPSAT